MVASLICREARIWAQFASERCCPRWHIDGRITCPGGLKFYAADVRVVRPSAPASGEPGSSSPLLQTVMPPAGLRGPADGEGDRRSRRQPAADTAREILEVVGSLEGLAVMHEETRSSVFAALESGDEPDYATAYQALFSAVAMLSPAQAARVIDATLGSTS